MGIRRAIWTEEVAGSSGVLSRVGIGHSGDVPIVSVEKLVIARKEGIV
jgi:hypothetical protein